MAEEFAVGDAIVWWDDGHGGGIDPAAPGAERRTGVVDSVHRHPKDPSRIVAYLVECRGGVVSTYLTTARPDWHTITRDSAADL